jgi:hypothetical protein
MTSHTPQEFRNRVVAMINGECWCDRCNMAVSTGTWGVCPYCDSVLDWDEYEAAHPEKYGFREGVDSEDDWVATNLERRLMNSALEGYAAGRDL